jgi:transposase
MTEWGVPERSDRCKLHLSDQNEGNDKKYGKRFDEEFQRDAVRMLQSGERTIGQLSQELGVSTWSLKRWTKLHSRGDKAGTGGSLSALELENAKLRRELETVSRQRDILSLVLSNRGIGNLPNCSTVPP